MSREPISMNQNENETADLFRKERDAGIRSAPITEAEYKQYEQYKAARRLKRFEDRARSPHLPEIGYIVDKPEQIPNLPWEGNCADDLQLIEACTRYIELEKDPIKAREAERLYNWHGFGIRID
jgi:hypothetical protein